MIPVAEGAFDTGFALLAAAFKAGVAGVALVMMVFHASPVWGQDRARLAEVLSGPSNGFARAIAPRRFEFPRDHGAHPDFRVEWWYLTGNLFAGQTHFGFQLTFFRFGIRPSSTEPPKSQWQANDIYMGHFALTDVANGTFHPYERFARGALGLAGAEFDPPRVWLENWQLSEGPKGWTVTAEAQEISIALVLVPQKPIVLQGEEGLSRKSGTPGNASYYYSMTRMQAQGQVKTPRGEFAVNGRAWFDREWSTSALDKGQVGWDWFALQLEDGRDLMYYQMRGAGGGVDPVSAGVLVEADGSYQTVRREEVVLTVVERWTTPDGEHAYPARWLLEIPSHHLRLGIEPALAHQYHEGFVHYWEGAVRVSNDDGGTVGFGYVELTGY
ncbi:MAG: carotenoid 1,2-hydratase [Chromatiales bacterium]|jgi:predicted secreted hydrolase|nr:carotenoid 1,2-hydratase [Chromatiales bacterium]